MDEDNLNNQKYDFSFSSFMEFNTKIMFRESGLPLNDVIEMVMGFSISFGHTFKFISYNLILKLKSGNH